MRRTAFGTTKNRVLVGETYSTNNDSAVLASIMAKHKQNGLVGYSDNNGTIKAPRFEGDLIGNATTSTRANTVSYTVAVNGSVSITGNPEYLNSDLYLNASGIPVLTIISPNATGVSGLQYKIYNISSLVITLSNNANFAGKYGSGIDSLIVPANTWVQLNSNGMNWLVVDRSVENQNYTLTTSDATFTDASTNYQYGGAKLYLTSNYETYGTFSGVYPTVVFDYPRSTFNIPSASNENSLKQTYTIYNNSLVNNIRLSSDSSFIGQYQNNESPIRTSDIGVNSSLIFYSNGTSWVVTSGSSTLSNLQIANTSNIIIKRENFRRTNVVSVYNNVGVGPTITFFAPIASDLGLDYYFTRLWSNGTGTVNLTCSQTNPIIQGFNSNAPITSGIIAITTTNYALARITARQTGYSGGGSVYFPSSGLMIIVTHTSGFIFYNSIITFSGGKVSVTLSTTSSSGVFSNGGNPPTKDVPSPYYNVVLVSGDYPAYNTTVSATWNDIITWVVG